MKNIIIKYGTFLIIPIIISGIAVILCTLKVREKFPVTLIILSNHEGIAYIPQNYNMQIIRDDTLMLESSQYKNEIPCLVNDIVDEQDYKRVFVEICTSDSLNKNSLCHTYITTKEIPMFDLVILKILKL